MAPPSNEPDNNGFLVHDADEIYCRTLTGQCNIYSLHVIKKPVNIVGDDWILVVTLFGKVYRFSIDDEQQRRSHRDQCKLSYDEFDLRNEFPSQYADLEVVSSCHFQSADSNEEDDVFLYLSCVDNRFHLSGNNSTSGSGVPFNAAGLIIIVKVSPPWKATAPLARIVRTLGTSYPPTLVTTIPLRRRVSDSGNDHLLFVSGSDRSIHGYRIEMKSGKSAIRDGEISAYECYLGEPCPEFDTFLGRGKVLPGTIIQMDIREDGQSDGNRLTALGFDIGHLSVCQNGGVQYGPVESNFDTPITAVRFIPLPSTDSSSDACTDRLSLLICPAAGPARLYHFISGSNWIESPPLLFPGSDEFDCITCAEYVTIHSSDKPDSSTMYILLGTFSGKILIYTIDREGTSITKRRVHSLLSPIMQIRQFGERYVAVMLMYTLMIFEL